MIRNSELLLVSSTTEAAVLVSISLAIRLTDLNGNCCSRGMGWGGVEFAGLMAAFNITMLWIMYRITLQKKRPSWSQKLNGAITGESTWFAICSAAIVVYGNLAFWDNIIRYSENYTCSFDRAWDPASDVVRCLSSLCIVGVESLAPRHTFGGKTGASSTHAPFDYILSKVLFNTSVKSWGEEPTSFFLLVHF